MRNKTKITSLMAVLMALVFLPACLVVSGGDPDDNDTSPHDPFSDGAECFSDLECDGTDICLNNTCQSEDTDERGSAGLCQACEGPQDCSEEGALCVGFLDDSDNPHETVCGSPCQDNHDCPSNFECVDPMDPDNPDSTTDNPQCVPERDGDQPRTCQAGGDLECVTAQDCETGERCENNFCEPPNDAECVDDGQCESGEVCEVFECIDEADSGECVVSDDCSGNDVCVDGQCTAEAESCVFNADCADDERCVDGQCILTCDDNADCGSSEWCRNGICEFIQCYSSGDCSPGQICVDASCEQSCSDDDDCAAGYLCSGLDYCEPDPDVECRSSAECPADQGCNEDLECESACTCNDDCSGDEICGEDSNLCVDADSGEDGLEC